MSYHRRWLLFALTFFVLSASSCSDESGPVQTEPDPEPEEFAVFMTGPDEVTLGCTGGAWTAYQVADWTGTINDFSWEIDGAFRNDGLRTTYRFDSMGTHTVILNGFDKNSALVAADTQAVDVKAPGDLVSCLAQVRILGREGVLLRTGASQVTSEYRANIAEVSDGLVDRYTWTLRPEGGEAEVVAQGADASTMEATFTGGGQYEIGLALESGETTLTTSLPVTVYTGAPVSEPGKIVFTNGPYRPNGEGGRSDRKGIYFMDGETGHVSGPVVSSGDGVYSITNSSLACDDSRILFAGNLTQETPADQDLWQVSHDGTGLKELVEARGLLQDADISIFGDVALIDDTRWNGDRDEIAFYSAAGSFTHASGATTDTLYVGFNPSWSPGGDRIAFGSTRVGGSHTKVSIFQVRSLAGGENNVLRTGKAAPELMGLTNQERVLEEGGSGVAWDPRGEYIAYTVVVSDTTNNESRSLIALWSLETDQVRVLAEGYGHLSWSPNGNYLLYMRPDAGEIPGGIWQIPRGGGTPVNLSDITQVGANDELGGFCKRGP